MAARARGRAAQWAARPCGLGPAIAPWEILLEEYLKPLGVGQLEAAKRLGISLNRLNEIVVGKRGITADTALRLGKYFGVSPEVWLGLQADYDLRIAKRTTWLKAEPRVR